MPRDLLEFGEEFQPGKPLEVSEYRLPKSINLENGTLVWEPGGQAKVRPTVQTFQAFLNLAEAPDEEILAFAKTWGTLAIAGPYTKGWMEGEIDYTGGRWTERITFSASDSPNSESCNKWRRLAKIGGAVLEIALSHRHEKRGKPEHWLTLAKQAEIPIDLIVEPRFLEPQTPLTFLEDFMTKQGFRPLTDREMAKAREEEGLGLEKWFLEDIVNEWLIVGGVRPALTLKGHYELVLLTRGLFGSLAVQLLELVGGHMLAACTGCRRFYQPKRAPRADQDRFCEPCTAAKVPVKFAKRRKQLGMSKPRNKRTGRNKQKGGT